MSNSRRNQGNGRQPEALSSLAATARNRDERPDNLDEPNARDGQPLPADPKKKDAAATLVLREGTLGRDLGADEAIDALPDRTKARRDDIDR
jgi:hypothetical protein